MPDGPVRVNVRDFIVTKAWSVRFPFGWELPIYDTNHGKLLRLIEVQEIIGFSKQARHYVPAEQVVSVEQTADTVTFFSLGKFIRPEALDSLFPVMMTRRQGARIPDLGLPFKWSGLLDGKLKDGVTWKKVNALLVATETELPDWARFLDAKRKIALAKQDTPSKKVRSRVKGRKVKAG
jgi:hypothetical protein